MSFSGGSGTLADPYLISKPDDLFNLSVDVQGGNGYSDTYFQITNNIDMSRVLHFPPIGTTTIPFCGIFDGFNHTITNLTLLDIEGGGFFGYLGNGANIKNLNVNCPNFQASYVGCGILVGAIELSQGSLVEISNCSTSGSITRPGDNAKSALGGLIGRIQSIGSNTIFVSNSYSTVDIDYKDASFVGGLIGSVYSSGSGSGVEISNCYATGSITSTISPTQGSIYHGGLVGRTYTIDNGTVNFINCAALNSIVTGLGSVSRTSALSGSGITSTNTYALSTMVAGGSVGGTDVTPAVAATQEFYTNTLTFTFPPWVWNPVTTRPQFTSVDITMYPAIAGSPLTTTASVYSGVENTITVAEPSSFPDAPNLVSLYADGTYITLRYTTKTSNVLGGLEYVEGNQRTVYPIGSVAARIYTNYDHQAFINNIYISSTDVTGIKAKLDTIETGAQVNILDGIQLNGSDLPISNKKSNIPLATPSANGAMASADKSKLDGIEEGADVNLLDKIQLGGVDIPIVDKVSNIPIATTSTDGGMSSLDKSKLDGIESGAEVNLIDVIQVNGTDLAITNKTANIPPVSTTADGVMVSADKDKLDGVETGAEVNILEGVKVDGTSLPIAAKSVNVPLVSTSTAGVMAPTDKTKLDGIETGAQVNVLDGIQVGGVDAPITSKKSNVPIATNTNLGVISVGQGLGVDANGALSVTSVAKPIYGLLVDWTNSNPATWFTYTRGAIDMSPASPATGEGSWADSWLFSDEYRYYVVLHNATSAGSDPSLIGTENYRLNPENIFQKLDGTPANLDGTDGDVMVCFKHYYQTYLDGVNTGEFLFSPEKPGNGWEAKAFEFDGTIRDRVYVGVFQATLDSDNKLRSVCDYTNELKPRASTNIVNFDTYATNNNTSTTTGYSQWNYNLYDMMERRFWLKYRNSNSQAVLGYGYCSTVSGDPQPDIVGGSFRAYDASTDPYAYGGDPSGYDYGLVAGTNAAGTSYTKVHSRFEGLDDLWGNVVQWCKGVSCASGSQYGDTYHHLRFAPSNASLPSLGDTSWKNIITQLTANANGYISNVARGVIEPCAPISFTGGASNKYLCDNGYLYAGAVAASGGAWADTAYAGVSRLRVYYSLSYAAATIGGRLVKYSDISIE